VESLQKYNVCVIRSRNPPEPLVCATNVNDGRYLKAIAQAATELSAVGNAVD